MATVISPVRVDIVTTARQIVEARSVDEIVSATLHAARDLLQTDVAFLTELREGTLRLRASLGLHHPTAFADYAVPIGKGISGRVAATNRPLTVRDYRHDPRRVAPLSPSLDAEGLISAVMAPFRRDDGRVSGVLNTATRSPRAFSDEEADLLTALAGLASLVLARAEESDALNANLARLNAASQTYNSELRAQEAMIEALLAGEDADVAVQAAGARLGVTFLLQHGGDSVAGARSVITAAVAGGSWQLSAIDVSGNVSQRTVARLADVLALQLARERALLDVELRLGQQLVDALLVADEESLHTLERRAARLGIDLSAPRAVVCIKTPEPVDRRLLDRLARITASMSPESLLTAHDDMAVVLWALPADDDAPSAQLEISALLDRLSMPEATAGIGSVCSRAADFGDSLREAVFALETAAHSSRRRRIATAQQLGMYRVFAQVSRVTTLRQTIEQALGPLQRSDSRANSELVHTLRVYLERDRRLADTARYLHIHVNTLRQRLARIAEVLAVDLDDPDVRFFLQLALRMSSVLGVSRSRVGGTSAAPYGPQHETFG